MNDALNKIVVAIEQHWDNFLLQVPSILLAILIIALGFLLTQYLVKLTQQTLNRKVTDPLMTNFITKTVKVILGIFVIVFGLRIAGLEVIVAGLLTAAGASAIVIGFAFKDIGENFISGVILSYNRPFDVNDTVSIGDIFGKVKTMEFRYTKLKTFDGRDVYIPNSDVIKKPVFNYTEDGYFRLDFMIGIAYEDNFDEAEKLILATVRKCSGVIENPTHETFVALEELATSTVNLRVYFWVETTEYRKEALKIQSDVMAAVKTAIEENGFSMPADIQEIKLYGSQKSIPVRIETNGNIGI